MDEKNMGAWDVGKAQQGLVRNMGPEEALAAGIRDLMQVDCFILPC